MAISICFIGGIIAAACGCGGRHDAQELAKVLKLEKEKKKKTAPVPADVEVDLPCICGGSLKKMGEVTRCASTHHTKRVLQKHHRDTVRGRADY